MNHASLSIITGAAAGLGKSFAIEAARQGYDVLLIDLPGTGLAGVAKEIAASYAVGTAILEQDMTAENAVEKIACAAKFYPGKVAMLINNAAIGINEPFAGLSADRLQQLLLLNVVQTSLLIHKLIPLLKQSERAHIINIASLAASFHLPNKSAYAASKAYLRSLSLTLRGELHSSGIMVSVACPNGILTNAMHERRYTEGSWMFKQNFLKPEVVAAEIMMKALKGKAIIVPGRFAQFIQAIASLVPMALQLHLVQKLFGKPFAGMPAGAIPEKTNVVLPDLSNQKRA